MRSCTPTSSADLQSHAAGCVPVGGKICGNGLSGIRQKPTALALAAILALGLPIWPVDQAAAQVRTTESAVAEAQVVKRTRDWAAAWSARDFDAYVDFYSEAFQPQDLPSRAAWVNFREPLIRRPTEISVQLSDLTTRETAAGQIEVRFWQRYVAAGFEGTTLKTLLWAREGSDWKIVREVVLGEKSDASQASASDLIAPVMPQATPPQRTPLPQRIPPTRRDLPPVATAPRVPPAAVSQPSPLKPAPVDSGVESAAGAAVGPEIAAITQTQPEFQPQRAAAPTAIRPVVPPSEVGAPLQESQPPASTIASVTATPAQPVEPRRALRIEPELQADLKIEEPRSAPGAISLPPPVVAPAPGTVPATSEQASRLTLPQRQAASPMPAPARPQQPAVPAPIASAPSMPAAAAVTRGSVVTLEEAFRLAISTHPSVQARRADRQAADERLDGAKWGRFPSLTVQNGVDQLGDRFTSARLEQPLWTGGVITGQIDSAGAGVRSADAAIEEAQQEMLNRVAAAYTELGRIKARRIAAQANVAEHERLAALIERRVESEVSPSSDGVLARARLSQARTELTQLDALSARAQSALQQAIGQDVGDIAMPSVRPIAYDNLSDVVSFAFNFSPTLARLSSEAEAVDAEIQIRKGSAYPKVVARYDQIWGGNNIDDNRNQERVILALEYQSGSGFSSISAVREAAARRETARAAQENARREILDQISADWSDMQAFMVQSKDLRSQVEATTGVFDSFIRQYAVGRKSWLDVLNAQREASQARYALADVEWGNVRAMLRLQIATGEISAANLGVFNSIAGR